MNKVILMGRLTRDPEVRYSQAAEPMAVARFALAINRRNGGRESTPAADFINCVAFGKNGEFAEKYLHKGIKILVTGRIQTGSYTNREGTKVYTTDVVVEEFEFAENKASSEREAGRVVNNGNNYGAENVDADGFLNIPEGIEEELPFS